MEKQTIKNMTKESNGSLTIQEEVLIDWFYENGYEIVKMKVTTEGVETLQINPKSTFMEEVKQFVRELPTGTNIKYAVMELAKIVDKHMAAMSAPLKLTMEEETEEAKKRC